MLGYVGQHGWAHDYSGKSNAYRDTATPILYVHPSTECSAQVVFNIARATLDLVHRLSAPDVVLGDEPVNGAWSTRTAEGGAATWLRAGLRPDDELTVIRLAHPNETAPGGTNIATLLASRPLFTEEGAFLPETVTLLMQLRGPI